MRICRSVLAGWSLILCLLLSAPVALAVLPGNPNEAEINSRGFDPSKIYGSFDIDHVDLFSGSLRITIPIGQQYPVNGGLSYGLSLVYNSSVFTYHDIPDEFVDWLEAVPNPLQPGLRQRCTWHPRCGSRAGSPPPLYPAPMV